MPLKWFYYSSCKAFGVNGSHEKVICAALLPYRQLHSAPLTMQYHCFPKEEGGGGQHMATEVRDGRREQEVREDPL